MDDINKFLTETIGECWHEHQINHLGSSKYECSCGGNWDSYALEEPDHHTEIPIDFFTWEGFGKLWEWASEQPWFLKWWVWDHSTP